MKNLKKIRKNQRKTKKDLKTKIKKMSMIKVKMIQKIRGIQLIIKEIWKKIKFLKKR